MTIEESRQLFQRIENAKPGDRAMMINPGMVRAADIKLTGTVQKATKTQLHIRLDNHRDQVAIFRKRDLKGIGDAAAFLRLVDIEAGIQEAA